MPTSTSRAMPSSTTIGIPYVALVAAKNRPFSIDRKPITCGTALERVIIIRNDISTQASAMPSVPRAIERESSEIGSARLNAKTTSATYGMPMVVELGIALDVLVGMVILGVFLFQIREQFDSLDIHHLEKLKDE